MDVAADRTRPSLTRTPAFQAAATVLMTGWALVDPNALSRRGRWAYRLGGAVVTGGFVTLSMREQPVEELDVDPRLVGAAAAAAVLVVSPAAERADARWHGWLRRRGVRRPRLLTAALSTASYVLGEVGDRRLNR